VVKSESREKRETEKGTKQNSREGCPNELLLRSSVEEGETDFEDHEDSVDSSHDSVVELGHRW